MNYADAIQFILLSYAAIFSLAFLAFFIYSVRELVLFRRHRKLWECRASRAESENERELCLRIAKKGPTP
jgi:hypothetical protein